tara:strand:- start:77 stop:325 length:249 start_codon:yes stop_codon:yes gene_type:complete
MFSKGLVKTSVAAAELGISTVYLKNLREEYGGFLVGGEDYFLGVSQTDSIKWDVAKVAKKMHEMGRVVREGRRIAKELQTEI